ncbi:MAG: hypothetical protein KTR19_05085 [Hyphomicrobiales bacterium]|nr:hypothetical protein [Hyphomicrobiales bacterium]
MAGLAAVVAQVNASPDAEPGLISELKTGYDDMDILALKHAGSQGNFAALLKLAEIYDTKTFKSYSVEEACIYYIHATDRAGRFDRFHPDADRLATALRKAADCFIDGVGTPNGTKDPNRAGKLLFDAGVILEDAESLFKLGKLFLTADGIGPNLGMATRFLESAARKQYPPAQALLGSMMWEGKVTKHQPVAGLALLILGKERTHARDRAWITTMHDEAIITAPRDVERQARVLVEKWKAVHTHSGPKEAPAQQLAIPSNSRFPSQHFDGEGEAAGFADAADELTKKTRETHSPASADAVLNK